MTEQINQDGIAWPVLRRYVGGQRRAISLPLGGIGTGTVGFGGRGELRDWELQNHPNKGSRAPGTFFAVRASGISTAPCGRVLEGALYDEEYEGALGSPVPLAGLPRFSECSFEAAYPFGRVCLADEDFPLAATVSAFNPLIPGDIGASSLPIIVWRVGLQNKSAEAMDVSVMLSVANFIGDRLRRADHDLSRPIATIRHSDQMIGWILQENGLDDTDEEWGSFVAAAVSEDCSWAGPVWSPGKWNCGIRGMWDSFIADGRPRAATGAQDDRDGVVNATHGVPAVTVGTSLSIPSAGHVVATFAFSWSFPNRRSWVFKGPGPKGASGDDIWGNAYTSKDVDPWTTLEQRVAEIDDLERLSKEFVGCIIESDLPEVVKEASLFNLSTLRSPTVFRSADGMMWGWEGVLDHAGSCPGSCTHVWNYDLATPLLFGELALRMRENELIRATAENGAMSFRIGLPTDEAHRWDLAAADGQFGCLIKLYREWQASGDYEFLRRLWPSARRALEFSWLPGGWDADMDGVAEGALHNTLDIEYFGPTGVIQGWYLGALRAMAAMAEAVGDSSFSARCTALEKRGSAWTEDHLFNGDYYEQEIRPPREFEQLRPETRHVSMGSTDPNCPEFQMGSGCQVDQLVGGVIAENAGLGKVFDADHARRSLAAVHRFNYVPRFADWTNHMRSYALGDDRGHIVMSYPNGMPKAPMPYWCEVMTGYEYAYALALVQAGSTDQAEDVVASIRERYDGRRRNPFDEAECGHHYARAMIAWGLISAYSGFQYSAVEGRMELSAPTGSGRWPWSTGWAWGSVTYEVGERGVSASIKVTAGRLRIRCVVIGGIELEVGKDREFGAGETLELGLGRSGN